VSKFNRNSDVKWLFSLTCQSLLITRGILRLGTVVANVQLSMKLLVIIPVLFSFFLTAQKASSDELDALAIYARSIADQNSSKDIKIWQDLEKNILERGTFRQTQALKILDTYTNQLSERTNGFEWGSNARIKYLRLIQKIEFSYQVTYFEELLNIGLLGFENAKAVRNKLADDGLREGHELAEIDFDKLRIARQAISHYSEKTEAQLRDFLKEKKAELEKLDRAEKKMQRLSESFIGRCTLKMSSLRIFFLELVH
jgi:hypothetical protein